MFYIGQKVRFIGQKGEGTIVKQLDKRTLEVDLGDDFPVEFDVDELIPIDRAENMLLPEAEKKQKSVDEVPVRLGTKLFELSLVVAPIAADHFELLLVNPEKWELMFVCYYKIKGKYVFFQSGKVAAQQFQELGRLSKDELTHCRAFHFQLLQYAKTSGLPQAPVEKNFDWTADKLTGTEPAFLDLVKKEAWIFSLREKNEKPLQSLHIETTEQPFYTPPVKEVKLLKTQKIVDLHIEKLVKDTRGMDNADMLFRQVQAFDKEFFEAIAEGYRSLVVIHGVGEGKLKRKIHEKLQFQYQQHISSFQPADMLKFGGGATEVKLKVEV